ncbi:MAG: alanine racemase [Pseudohongiellaceae bacterium]
MSEANNQSGAQITPRTWAIVDLKALQYNLGRVRQLCPHASIVPVIKSNGYGHGMIEVAKSLAASSVEFDSFIVATLKEALELHDANLGKSIVLLAGFIDQAELRLCLEKKIQPVIHSAYQVQLVLDLLETEYKDIDKKFWIEFNSGMNRLGQRADDSILAFKNIAGYPKTELVFMSHLAFADDMTLPASRDFTNFQVSAFDAAKSQLESELESLGVLGGIGEFGQLECSFAASAGILSLPNTHHNTVRPGVMLYGSSPLSRENGVEVGLQPVMTLKSRLMAINEVKAGDAIGYGATYVCPKDTRIGVVSVGYGDGYPRSATSDTPVLVKTKTGSFRTHVVGRVSMDMITIDLGNSESEINDEVVLWGEGLCADEVAKTVGTIAYELFCKVTNRVECVYQD